MHILLFLLLILLMPMSSFCEDIDDDWGTINTVEVIDTTKKSTKKTLNYWDEHLYGSISGSTSFGANHNRFLGELKVGYSENWKNTKFVLEGAYYNYSINTKAVITTEQNNITISEENTTKKLGFSNFSIRQAFIETYPIDSVTFSIGKQTIVWGQFDIMSPVDLLLPMGFNPTGFSLSKADNRMPQTVAKLAYYPVSNVELTGYYFPFFEEGELFKSVDFEENWNENDLDENNIQRYYTKKITPSNSKQSSYAARATWYHDSFTTAFTYYNGFNHLFPWYRERFVDDKIYDQGTPHERYRSFFSGEIGYFPLEGYAGELSIPMGQMTFKAEGAISDFFHPIDIHSDDKINQETVNLLRNKNNGTNNIPIYLGMFVVGIDADFDTWFFNLYIIHMRQFKNPSMNGFWDAYKAANNGKEEKLGKPVTFPTLNIGRYFNKEKKGGYGVALGFLTGSLGAVLYTSNEISDSWRWGLSLEALFGTNDLAAMLANIDNDEDSSGKETFTDYKFVEPKITFGLSYKI